MSAAIHTLQLEIITRLRKCSRATFTELNHEAVSTDLFSYHLRQVLKHGWVKKSVSGQYYLSPEGKKVALQYSQAHASVLPPQRQSVLLVVQHEGKFLVQVRSHEPFKGYWEFPTERVPFGESPLVIATALLSRETGLKGTVHFCGLLHKIEQEANGQVFDDKYYLVFQIQDTTGELLPDFDGGQNTWLTEADFLKKRPNHFDLLATLRIVKNERISFEEVSGVPEGY